MGRTKAPEYVATTRLINSRDEAIRLYLEPWGEEYDMPPAATFQIVARGPREDAIEVTIGNEQITVWGWPGSILRVFHDGTELGAGRWERSPVPPMPPLRKREEPTGQGDSRARPTQVRSRPTK